MKITSTVARYLLGLIFFVFGLNGFLHFIPTPMPPGVAGQFFGSLYVSHYLVVVFLLELLGAGLLLLNRYVPLALTVLAPVLFNILCFHGFMAPSGLPMAFVLTLCWLLVFFKYRSAFAGLFQKSAAPRALKQTL